MNFKIEEVQKSTNTNQIKRIYETSFKEDERLPFMMMQILSKLRSTHFYAYYEEDEMIGFSYFGVKKNITFITFLAVDESKRSLGYGKLILNHIQLLYPNNKIILTIEPSEKSYDYTQRSKRKRFYLENGFLETDYYMKLGGKEQEILIKNGDFKKEELFLFFLRYSNFTMIKKIYKKIEDVK